MAISFFIPVELEISKISSAPHRRIILIDLSKDYHMKTDDILAKVLKLDFLDRQFIHDAVLMSLPEDVKRLSPADRKEFKNRVRCYRANPKDFPEWREIDEKFKGRRRNR